MSVRILLPQHILQQIDDNLSKGATMSSQLRLFSLDMSLPALTKLVSYYREGYPEALFPDGVGDLPQPYQQPKGVRFNGNFPNGHWELVE